MVRCGNLPRHWQGHLFRVWLCEKDNSAVLTTKLGEIRCDPLMGPSTCKIVGDKSMLSLSGQLRSEYGFQSGSTHQLRHKPPLSKEAVQPLSTSPGNPYSTSRCNQNETRWPFCQHVPIQRERGVVGIQSMRKELGHGLYRKVVRVHQLE